MAKCKCSEEVRELRKQQLYDLAEFENYKKRQAGRVMEAFQEGKGNVIVGLLPIIEAFNRAASTIKDEGMTMLKNNLDEIFKNAGLEEIDANPGNPFNPEIHNAAMMEVVDGKPDGIILEEWQKGYKLDGKIIKYATVKVSGK